MIVVDASVVANAIGRDDEMGELARHRIAGRGLCAPELIDAEVLSALRRMVRGGEIDELRVAQAIATLDELGILRVGLRALRPRIWQLRHNVTSYDAAYVALAEWLGAPLLTTDRRLAAAPGVGCAVELVG